LQEPTTCSYPEPVHATPSHILKIHFVNSLATAVSEPDLYMILTFHVPNLKFLFHRSYQRTSPGPWHMYAFRNKASY
jgi:hypothetical protein